MTSRTSGVSRPTSWDVPRLVERWQWTDVLGEGVPALIRPEEFQSQSKHGVTLEPPSLWANTSTSKQNPTLIPFKVSQVHLDHDKGRRIWGNPWLHLVQNAPHSQPFQLREGVTFMTRNDEGTRWTQHVEIVWWEQLSICLSMLWEPLACDWLKVQLPWLAEAQWLSYQGIVRMVWWLVLIIDLFGRRDSTLVTAFIASVKDNLGEWKPITVGEAGQEQQVMPCLQSRRGERWRPEYRRLFHQFSCASPSTQDDTTRIQGWFSLLS